VLTADEAVTFVEEVSTLVEQSPLSVETTESSTTKSKKTNQNFETIKEYKYAYKINSKLSLVKGLGVDPSDRIELSYRQLDESILLRSKSAAILSIVPDKEMRINVSWLFKKILDLQDEPVFMMDINRSDKACHTPTNNPDVLEATAAVKSILDWSNSVRAMMDSNIISLETYRENDSLDTIGVLSKLKLFSPVLPLFEYSASAASNPIEEAIQVRSTTLGSLLKEHKRGLGVRSKDLQSMFTSKSIVSYTDALLYSSMMHIQDLSAHFVEGLDSVDEVIHSQPLPNYCSLCLLTTFILYNTDD
jgi:hypothetical protein